MTFKTPATFIPPPNAGEGQGGGKPLYRKWERAIVNDGTREVNFADLACEVTDPLSGVHLNINIGETNDVTETINFDSRDLIYISDFNSGFDTLNDWTCIVNDSLVAESRTATPSGVGNDAIFYDSDAGLINLSFDAQGPAGMPYIAESKTVMRSRGTGVVFYSFTAPFEHIGAPTAATTTFSIDNIGEAAPPVSRENWNIDPLDGSGNSGIDLDFKTVQSLILKAELDNKGSVLFGFLVEGIVYYCHKFIVENQFSETQLINLQLRDQVERSSPLITRKIGLFNNDFGFAFVSTMDSTLQPSTILLQSLCDVKAYKVKSNKTQFVLPFTAGNRETSITVTAADTPICSVQTRPWFDTVPPAVGTFTNRTVWSIDQIQLFASGPDLEKACYIRVMYNATLGGGTSFVVLPGDSESRMMQDTASTTVTDGFEIFSTRILTNQIYTFYKKDIFKHYRNCFGYNRVVGAAAPVLLNQTITIVATPMDSTDTLLVAATIIGGEVG